MLREYHKQDATSSLVIKKRNREHAVIENVQLARARAANIDVAQETDLCSQSGLHVNIRARAHHKGSLLTYLKGQFKARVTGRGWKYPTIGMDYRSCHTKKLVMQKNGEDQVAYLVRLLELMISADLQSDHAAGAVTAVSAVRRYARISQLHTSQWSIDEQQRLHDNYGELCQPEDDALLVELLEKYKGRILFDFDDKCRPKRTYKDLDILYDNKGGSAYWEATCAEVRISDLGEWEIPDELYVQAAGERVVNPKILWGVILVCLKDPDNPVHKPYADEYILAHEQSERARLTAS